MTTVLDHYKTTFPDFLGYDVLNNPSRAGDGTTDADILEEMPLDSNCGDSCREAIDAASKMIGHVREAFGDDKPDHIQNILLAVVDTCGCFIRG